MNELMNLHVTTTNGVITSNMEEIRTQIKQKADSYAVVQYEGTRDDQIKLMKSDRADLNKLVDDLNESRKKIKKEFMKPYNLFEAQAKELIELIKTPLDRIDQQVKQLEREERAEKNAAIENYYHDLISGNEAFSDQEWADVFYKKVYDPSWSNKSTSQKVYKTALTQAVESYTAGLATVKGMRSDYVEDGIEKLRDTLDVTQAIMYIQKRDAEKEELLRKERERMEREREKELARMAREREDAIAAAEHEARRKAEAEAKEKLDNERKQMEAEKQRILAEQQAKNAELKQEAERLATEKKKAELAGSVFHAGCSTTGIAGVSATAGTVLVSFDVTDWEMLKEYCDENYIGYSVQRPSASGNVA